jgi:mannose-6-phosphate isomerase-like protein (cupin superfamily)
MPEVIASATEIPVPGGKIIMEYVGRVNSGESAVSIAHMNAPAGWTEPFQTPEFDEYTIVLQGRILVEHGYGVVEIAAGQAIVTRAGERIRYATPPDSGAEYVAVCLPAFRSDLARRDDA